MNEIEKLLVALDILPKSTVEEQARWAPAAGDDDQDEDDFRQRVQKLGPEQVRAEIGKLLDTAGFVLIRRTDLDAVHTFMQRAATGTIVLYDENGKAHRSEVSFARSGKAILLPMSQKEEDTPETVEDLLFALTDGKSYLEADGCKVFFGEGSECIYMGEKPSFLLLRPSDMRLLKPKASPPPPAPGAGSQEISEKP